MSRPLLLCAALLLAAAGPAQTEQASAAGRTGPVVLSPQPGTPLDATAREVAAADLEDGGAGALLLLGSEKLGSAGTGPALFVQVQSQRACGSAGCSTSVYLPTRSGWHKVLDAVSGAVIVEPAEHHGMHDLLVGKNDRWVWNGSAYADTLPAPQVDLRPRDPGHGTGHNPGHATKTPSPAHP